MRSYFPSVRLQGISLPAPEEQKWGRWRGDDKSFASLTRIRGLDQIVNIVPIDIMINITLLLQNLCNLMQCCFYTPPFLFNLLFALSFLWITLTLSFSFLKRSNRVCANSLSLSPKSWARICRTLIFINFLPSCF